MLKAPATFTDAVVAGSAAFMGAQVAEAAAAAVAADMADMADIATGATMADMADMAAPNKPAISTVAVQTRIFGEAVLMDDAPSMDAPDQSKTFRFGPYGTPKQLIAAS